MTRQQRPTRAPSTRRRADRQDGSATVELAVLGPVLIMVLLTIVGVGRVAVAKQVVQAAAGQAARAASIARTQDTAQADALSAAQATLNGQSLHCKTTTVTVDTSQLSKQVGDRADVSVTVTCVVDLGDVSGLAPLPGSLTVTKTDASPIDTYRG